MGHPSPPPSLATLRFGQASDGGSEGMAQPDPMIDFAELDAHNFGLGQLAPAITPCGRLLHQVLTFLEKLPACLVGTSRRFVAVQCFVGYRGQIGLWQASIESW
jgi:hypothetical protein